MLKLWAFKNVLVMFTFRRLGCRHGSIEHSPETSAGSSGLPSAPAGGFVDDATGLLGLVVDHERRRGPRRAVECARAATSRWRASPSTTAGAASTSCRRSRRRSRSTRRARSSPATIRPTSASTARSIPIAAASTAASTASPARRTPISACRPGSISNPSCSSSRRRPTCWRRNYRRPAMSRRSSPSAPIPTPISRSSAATR